MLELFEDLLIFTGGIACLILWLVVIVGVGIEIYDFFTKKTELAILEDEDEL